MMGNGKSGLSWSQRFFALMSQRSSLHLTLKRMTGGLKFTVNAILSPETQRKEKSLTVGFLLANSIRAYGFPGLHCSRT